MTKHIVVLKGGRSAEREVSLVSGAACAAGLREAGYRVTELDVGVDVAARLAALQPDAVFNALHGRFGEDGCMQGLLESMGIPYTHSGVLASSVAMDKPLAKLVFAAHGLRCPAGRVASKDEVLSGSVLSGAHVIKPSNEGSSVGVCIVQAGAALPFDAQSWPYGETVLVEPYIAGQELTVAVLLDQPLAVTELRVMDGFYDYTNKYTDGKTEHHIPAPVPMAIAEAAKDMALSAHRALGCRGLTRSDFRYDATQGEAGLYLLEINTQPGMTPLSLAPEQAKFCDISFAKLVQMLVEDASICR